MFFGRTQPTQARPAYVYEIELDDPLPPGLQLLDPIKEVVATTQSPLSAISYQHDGLPDFLLGVVNPSTMGQYLSTPTKQPPPGGGTTRSANLTPELEALVRALRDAEILAVGNIPASCIQARYNEW